MAWAKLDDRFFSHPKVIDLTKDAKLLFLCGLTYCSAHLTDGKITRGAFRMIAAQVDVDEQIAQQLLDAGLWESDGNGYIVHDYTDYNPTREQAEAKSNARSEAGRKGGLRSSQANAQAIGEANAQAVVKQYPVPVSRTGNNTHPNPPGGREQREVVLKAISQADGDDAASLQESICVALRRLNFDVKTEYPVPNRGDGRPGRVDIYAVSGSDTYAIEADWRNTREKSAFKLRQLNAFRVIALRDADSMDVPEGIHAVVAIGGGWQVSAEGESESGEDTALPSEPESGTSKKATRRGQRSPEPLSERQQEAFDKFWNRYPHKVGKQKAIEAWGRINPDSALWGEIVAGLKRWEASRQWQQGIVQHPTTWLNGREWESEPLPAAESPPGGNHATPNFRREVQAAVPAAYNNQL